MSGEAADVFAAVPSQAICDKNATHSANYDSNGAGLFHSQESYVKRGERLVDQPIDLDPLA